MYKLLGFLWCVVAIMNLVVFCSVFDINNLAMSLMAVNLAIFNWKE